MINNVPPSPLSQGEPSLEQAHLLQHSKLSITGMHCAACNQIIEYRLKKLDGINKFIINVTSHTAEVSWHPERVTLANITEAISSLGYGALPIGSAGELINREHKMNIWRLFVAGFAMMQVMMYALPAYLVPVPQVDGDLTPDIDRLLKLASLAITLPVVIFSSWPFFQSAFRDLRNLNIGMDVPVSIGITVTFIASVWSTFSGGPVYYDSLIMFVFFLLSARMIQFRVHNKSTSALRALTNLVPLISEKLPDFPASMRVEQILASKLIVGDYILVQPGAKIPVDGEVISGMSECDESLMTGESHAVAKVAGDSLIEGALNMNRPLVMQAVRIGDDTQLSTLVRMMEAAASEKPPLIQLADRYASMFLTIVLGLAIASGIVWWQIDSARAVWIAVTVMVITCPCALSLATPGVMSSVIGQLAKNGVLIARGRAVESLARATHYVFDKTGTLTQGRLNLVKMLVIRTDSELDENAIRIITTNITATSSHPVARALFASLATASEKDSITNFKNYNDVNEIPGQGIEVHHQDLHYRLGSINFVQQLHGIPLDLPFGFSGKTISALGDKEGYIAIFALEDTLRESAKYLIELLQQQGKTVLLFSGDRDDVVRTTASGLGIQTALANLSPEAKHNAVKKLQQQGAIVAMVGDGMNDGPVLSLANVSIAMGQGAPISQARSDMVLISNNLKDLAYAVKTTSKALSLIRQNLGWAVIYNVVAIPAAMAGILAPWHAAIGMSLSSIIVVLNSLRIYFVKSEKRPDQTDATFDSVLEQSASV
jgi:Cu2+-exporting ATPase